MSIVKALDAISKLKARARSALLGAHSLAAAQAYVAENLSAGVECPCCGQFAKLYPRKLYADQAAWLIWLVRRHTEIMGAGDEAGWVPVTESPVRGGDYAKVAHWGLCELRPKDQGDNKRTSGLWRPTSDGILFVRGQLLVPSHVLLFDNEVRGRSKDLVSIRDVLGEKFDYHELMTGTL